MAVTGTFVEDLPEGACNADYYLNLGGGGASHGAVSVASSVGQWVGGLRHGCNVTSVAVQRAHHGAGEGGFVSTTVHDGMCVALFAGPALCAASLSPLSIFHHCCRLMLQLGTLCRYRKGLRHGHGVLTVAGLPPPASYSLTGEWQKGELNGRVTVTWGEGCQLQANVSNATIVAPAFATLGPSLAFVLHEGGWYAGV